MKKKLLFVSLILLGMAAITTLNTACEEDKPKEACEQDIFCEGEPEVTLCCTDGSDCYWTYNGNDYPDTDEGLDQLYNDLGCATTAKSGDDNYIMEKLLAMRDRVIEASKR